jgi:primosomal protein N' (replication factor Y)
MFADVVLAVNARHAFTYRVPEGMTAPVGARVVVPFGAKVLVGLVVMQREEPPPHIAESAIKPLLAVLDKEPLLGSDVLELTRWVAEYYFAPWGEVVQAAVPPGFLAAVVEAFSITERGRADLGHMTSARQRRSLRGQILEQLAQGESLPITEFTKRFGARRARAALRDLERRGAISRHYRIAEPRVKPKMEEVVVWAGAESPSETEHGVRAKARARLLAWLHTAREAVPLREAARQAGVRPALIRALHAEGVVRIFSRPVPRDPFAHVEVSPPEWFELTPEQNQALEHITRKLDEGRYATFLLHGVTGSGKTEVYIRAIHRALARGKTALMLVPEIALTPMLGRRLRAHFGRDVALLHSSLSEGERFEEWHRIARGEARVVLGTRSAVFAPLSNLGLVIVDEEHDPSYKQDEVPRYHGRDTAIMRALQNQAVVILGSATPSLESYHNVHVGKYIYLQLGERIGGRSLAEVHLVDMREVFARYGRQVVLSDELVNAIRETIERGEQVILLLNRRGFSSFVLCRRCGLTMRCPRCDVSLTYHRSVEQLLCHYCNYRAPVLTRCLSCDGEYIYFAGVGTEQVEERLRRLFPDLRIARLDRDTASRRRAYERIIMAFAAGEIQVLVGTQMVAKGHDFPNVTLVGVISVDAILGLPDFRAAERAFQLLTQSAGRAGRGDQPGRVLIQTYYPEHYVLRYAAAQDYEGFYQREIHFRRMLHYPPITTLIQLIVQHRDFERANALAQELARYLRAVDTSGLMRVLGPAPAPLSRLRGRHRLQILIKSRQRLAAHRAVDLAVEQLRASGFDTHALVIDPDPVDVM